MNLAFLGRARARRRAAEGLVAAAAGPVRDRAFYEAFGVADTPMGRLELLVLHAALIGRALKASCADGGRLAQAFSDRLFRHLEDEVRELGVADLKVPRTMQGLAGAVLGRLRAYDEALGASEAGLLAAALERNVFEGRAAGAQAAALAAHMRAAEAALQALPAGELMAGRAVFPPIGHGSEAEGARHGRA